MKGKNSLHMDPKIGMGSLLRVYGKLQEVKGKGVVESSGSLVWKMALNQHQIQATKCRLW